MRENYRVYVPSIQSAQRTYETHLNNIQECFDVMHKYDHEWLQCESEKQISKNTSQGHENL